LNDPKFRIGGVIVRALINLVTKAAMSPFALLGGLFGGHTPRTWGKSRSIPARLVEPRVDGPARPARKGDRRSAPRCI
jgi:hypothetical protein